MCEPDSRPASFQKASASPWSLRALRGAGGPGVRLPAPFSSPLLHRRVVLGNRNVCQSWPFWGCGRETHPSLLACVVGGGPLPVLRENDEPPRYLSLVPADESIHRPAQTEPWSINPPASGTRVPVAC